jgi:hypothetical protein
VLDPGGGPTQGQSTNGAPSTEGVPGGEDPSQGQCGDSIQTNGDGQPVGAGQGHYGSCTAGNPTNPVPFAPPGG